MRREPTMPTANTLYALEGAAKIRKPNSGNRQVSCGDREGGNIVGTCLLAGKVFGHATYSVILE